MDQIKLKETLETSFEVKLSAENKLAGKKAAEKLASELQDKGVISARAREFFPGTKEIAVVLLYRAKAGQTISAPPALCTHLKSLGYAE